jgi:hypothetical protein
VLSTATATAKAPPERRSDSNETTPREDLVTAILGAGIIGGTITDGWAHTNLLKQVQQEGFFTPWHALLYSAFAATAGWTFFLAYRRRDRAPRWWVDGWPTGYRLGAVGVVVFLVAGICDMIWHTVFGIEATIDALLSPSHLLLCVGSVLVLTSATRSWWSAGGGGLRAAAGVLALALGTTSVSIFLLYASAFDSLAPTAAYDGRQDTVGQLQAAHGIASYVITMGLLTVPLLLAHRRRTTPGLATALVTLVSLFPILTHEFPATKTGAALAAIAGAALVDLILFRLDRTRGFDAPLRLPIAAAVFASVVTAAHLVGIALQAPIHWPVELWTGSVVVVAGVAAALGGLAARPAARIR